MIIISYSHFKTKVINHTSILYMEMYSITKSHSFPGTYRTINCTFPIYYKYTSSRAWSIFPNFVLICLNKTALGLASSVFAVKSYSLSDFGFTILVTNPNLKVTCCPSFPQVRTGPWGHNEIMLCSERPVWVPVPLNDIADQSGSTFLIKY